MIHYAGGIYGEEEKRAVRKVLDKGWLAGGEESQLLEAELANFVGRKYCILTNSGSSANLLAMAALELPKGSGVITPACTFPTTLNPIIQLGFVPVFLDSDPETLNMRTDQLEKAISSYKMGKIKAMFLPHSLGNPFDLKTITEFCKKHNLKLIEDCCDALGSTYEGKNVGTFGDIATFSFYPAHHMTLGGEGGAVMTDDWELAKRIRSYRDWGRGCWCSGGKSNCCGKRFEAVIDGVEYDHKYTYERIGWNLKPTEMQAAFGRVQLKRLPKFIRQRKLNYQDLRKALSEYDFIFQSSSRESNPSWFAFAITLKNASFSRRKLTEFLESKGIETRLMFGGNILRHPAYKAIDKIVVGSLDGADKIMKDTFFIGVYPGIGRQEVKQIKEAFDAFFAL